MLVGRPIFFTYLGATGSSGHSGLRRYPVVASTLTGAFLRIVLSFFSLYLLPYRASFPLSLSFFFSLRSMIPPSGISISSTSSFLSYRGTPVRLLVDRVVEDG